MVQAHDVPHIVGADLGLGWVVPFVGLLLSIAFLPLVMPKLWHRHFGKIAAIWSVAFVLPASFSFGTNVVFYELMHTLLLEYVPFIILLLALFTIGGGVRLKGQLPGTAIVNTGILGLGTALASIMGTTGASMLLIRPLIKSNLNRRYRVHVVVFFIFLVANIGGSLTPLGDPPLFLGFLNGVHFFWPAEHLITPMIILAPILLFIFFWVDVILHRREGKPSPQKTKLEIESFRLEGSVNLILLLGVLGFVILSGVWKPGVEYTIYHVPVALQNLARDAGLLFLTFLSLKLTSKESRKLNGFSWFPIVEVAMLFSAIFATMIPALAILRAGADGALEPLIHTLSDDNGEPVHAAYFWMTGILSSFLDNAPTYLVFFNTAGGDAQTLMTVMADTLLAISAGAVFFGAVTYIGNAPNFMVKAIAEQRGIPMPSFFGYMLWSCGILLPLYGVITFIFFI